MVQVAELVDGTTVTNLGGAPVNLGRRGQSLTANVTLTENDSGTLFLCNKAASLAITLPALITIGRQTRAWLAWLDGTLRSAAEDGLDMNEVMALPIPAEFRRLAVVEAEYRRSVGQLYPAYEQAALHRPRRSGP